MNEPPPVRIPLPFDPAHFRRSVGARPDCALLESGPGFGPMGRWCIYAAESRATFAIADRAWSVDDPHHAPIPATADPLDALAHFLRDWRLDQQEPPHSNDECPFRGGAIGFLGYDIAPLIERLPRKAPRTSRLPDARLAIFDTCVIADRQREEAHLLAFDLLGEGEEAMKHRAGRWLDELRRPAAAPRRSKLGPPEADIPREAHIASVGRILEYIRAGDIFQVNLAQRFRAEGDPDPLGLFERLGEISPAPFAALLRWGDDAIVSASPEWFYSVEGDHIITRPIKGTRPRGTTPESDAALKAELLASAKDRAELTMIVDLERNDLGRICRYGSVRVPEALTIETYAQVHHLVATVEGRLRPGISPVDVIRAVSPGGSITGAPKIRAMEIIDELEPCRRGPYTGAIGYLGRGGSACFNIAIRTLVVEGNTVSYHAGGGIVADSDPAAEYEETLHKGRGLHRLITESDRPR